MKICKGVHWRKFANKCILCAMYFRCDDPIHIIRSEHIIYLFQLYNLK